MLTVLTVGLLSGLAGSAMLAQDTVLAYYFGTSSAVDAYQLSLSVPSLLVNVLAGGALLAVLVPEFTRLTHDHAQREIATLIQYARQSLGALLAATALAWPIVYAILQETSTIDIITQPHPITNHLIWLMAPILFFVGATSIETAYLNSQRRFFITSTFAAFAPTGAIIFTILFSKTLHLYAPAIGALCGTICQWLLSRHLTRTLRRKATREARPAISASVGRHYLLNVLSSATLAGIVFTDIVLASTRLPGELSTYSYATRPVILLLAFLTVSIGNVSLPIFSHLAASGNREALAHQFRRWLFITAGISLIFLMTWASNCTAVVSILFERGAFQGTDVASVTEVQTVYLFQLPFYMAAIIGMRLLNALSLHRSLAFINFFAFIINLAFDRWLTPFMGLKGIALGTVAAFAVWALLIVGFGLRVTRPQLDSMETE
ncbi:MAG TPA: lipid II flippase MurJ [Bellilinea sp.]|nr:lipid II flippase MurJ [Bellilinea sp.]